MNLLVLLPLFLHKVFAQDAVVSGRRFKRVTLLDNFRPEGTPANTYKSRSKLECTSLCARDGACAAVMYHDGQCSIYGSPLSPSSGYLQGARCFNKDIGTTQASPQVFPVFGSVLRQDSVHHEYVGCYKFTSGWHFVTVLGMTPDTCSEMCSYRKGICSTFGLTKGMMCGLRSYLSDEKLPDLNCNTPCVGDRSKMCGGDNAISVYRMV